MSDVKNRLRKKLNDVLANASLCAKWCPRKGQKAIELRKALEMSPKQWRKTIVNMSKAINPMTESLMCAKDWDNINFGHVPSVAASRYRKAFMRNAKESYEAYVERLVKGEEKINASAIFPHDVLRNCFDFYQINFPQGTERAATKAQWDALPNLLGDDFVLPMVDVSGSMFQDIGGISALAVSTSLGAYLADKQTGVFANTFLTFTDRPTLTRVEGDVFDKIAEMFQHTGYSTNFQAAYKEILRVALKYKIAQEEMPRYLLVLSDMEFNACEGHRRSDNTLFRDAQRSFELAGYRMPKMIFWNLAARSGNSPVTFREDGTALVSGYSQNILKGIMTTDMDNFSPESVMMNTVMTERYDIF